MYQKDFKTSPTKKALKIPAISWQKNSIFLILHDNEGQRNTILQ